MPYTLKSDIARASLNLLNLKENSIVLDPFCGIGGILLEAEDLNFKVIGNDISWNITNSSGMVVASGGPYSNGINTYTITSFLEFFMNL